MTATSKRRALYGALLLLFVLRFDFWNWSRGDIVAGLPASLLYHLLICVAASVLLFVLTRYAWPTLTESKKDEVKR